MCVSPHTALVAKPVMPTRRASALSPAWPTVSKMIWASSLSETLIMGPSTEVSRAVRARLRTGALSR